MNHSASPAADHARRPRLWKRGPESEPLPALDAGQAEAAVRRGMGSSDHARSADDSPPPASREAADRVIANAVATGLSDPRAEPTHRRGRRIRRDLELVGDLVEHVPVAEPEPVAEAVAPPPTDLPADVRRELERATRELTEAAEAARQAREAAVQAATAHAEQTLRAEAAAKEQAEQAHNEAVRRRAAEQLASESAEQVAAAHAERVRVEVEAKRQFELAAEAAEARVEAERSALDSAERAAAAAAAREQAEVAAHELSTRLARAEQQTAELTVARAAADQQLREQTTEAESAHAARAEAEASAIRARLEREAAEARSRHLAATLEATRAQLLEQTRATLAAERARAEAAVVPPARAAAPTVVAVAEELKPEPTKPAAPEPEPRIWPAGADESVRFRTPGSGAVITVVLGLGALVAAGFAVYQAYLDRLTEPPGIVAAVVTLVLVIAIGRIRPVSTSVWLADGILHVETDEWHRKFDLTTKDTLVQMVGRPGDRRWKVLLLRKSQPTYEIDGSMVDPHELVPVLRRWRPEL